MRKTFAAITAALLLFSACVNTRQDEPIVPEPGNADVLLSVGDAKMQDDIPYSVKNETYSGEGVKITYPVFDFPQNSEAETRVNTLILSEVKKAGQGYLGSGLEVGYEVKLIGKNILSVLFSGSRYLPDSAYPTAVEFAQNIDLKSGRVLALEELVKIDAAFLKTLRTAAKTSQNEAAEEFLGSTSDAELTRILRTSSASDPADRLADFYFDDTGLTVIFDVIHALGDIAEVKIPYSSL